MISGLLLMANRSVASTGIEEIFVPFFEIILSGVCFVFNIHDTSLCIRQPGVEREHDFPIAG